MGQSWGQTIGAIVGGIIGAYFGQPGLGMSLGMMIGSAIDPPKGPEYGVSSYKKQDVYYNTIAHNLPVPIVYGVNRVAGNITWIGNVSATVSESGGGGKSGGSGGKDSGSAEQEVTIHAEFAVALSEGTIDKVTEVFVGDKRISEMEGLSYTVYTGTASQNPDPHISTDIGSLAPYFRNMAYMVVYGDVGDSPQIPIINAEVVGRCMGANSWGAPALAIQDFLTDVRYGMGVPAWRLDQPSFTAAHSYCAEMIPTGITSGPALEERFCLDYIIDQYRPGVEHLRDMLAATRGFLTWSQGVVRLHIDQPTSCTQSFGMAEIVADTFKWKRQSYRERPNVVRVEYVEPGAMVPNTSLAPWQQIADVIAGWIPDGSVVSISGDTRTTNTKHEYKVYRQDFVEASDPWDIDRTGERRERVFNLTGIKRRTQAQRMAYYYLNKAIHCPHACAFNVGIGALTAEVGDVIAVSHDIPRWQGKLFRIAEILENEDDTLTLGCLEYNEAVFSDSYAIAAHGQDTLYGTGSAVGGVIAHTARLSVYERPWENTVEVAYTRIVSSDLFGGVDLYIKRGAADYRIINNYILSGAPTAYLTPTVNTMTLVQSGTVPQYSDPIVVRGVPGGYSARLYRPVFGGGGTVDAECVASGGTIVLTPSAITPTSGWITLYSDGTSFTTLVPAAQWFGEYPGINHAGYPPPLCSYPGQYVGTLRGGDIYELRRVPTVISATQSWIPIQRALGGWTNGESLRVETEEIGYTTFTDSMLSGVTRGAHGTLAAPHTGVVSLGMVALNSGGADGALFNLLAACLQIGSSVPFFEAQSQTLYFGASSKFAAVNLWLARKGSHPVWLYGEYSTGQGSWGCLVSSHFVPAFDTSSGLQWDGQIAFEPPGNWGKTNEVTSGGLSIGDTTSRYYLRFTRVSSLLTTPPMELEVTLTSDVLAVVRKPGAYLYPLTLADSGQELTFKAQTRSIGGLAADAATSPTASYVNA